MTHPKLTKAETARLIEIGIPGRFTHSFRESPALTKRLHEKGLVSKTGGKIAKTGRVVCHADAHLTDAGKAVLAGILK